MRVSPRLDPMGRIVLACLVVLSLAGGFARAERLPVRTYTIEDGLPSDEIRKIVRDSHGYLWFLTDRGLCRFDGHVFTTFGPEFGLPVTRFTDFLETMDGTLLAGTFDGLYWYDPADSKCRDGFRHARPFESGFGNQIQSLIEDHDGHVLCGTGTGVLRLERTPEGWAFHPIDIGQPEDDIERNSALDLLVDRNGALWIATPAGLVWVGEHGASAFLTGREGLLPSGIVRLEEDSEGRIWATLAYGITILEPDAETGRPVVLRSFGARDGLVEATGQAANGWEMLNASDGTFWVTTYAGLVRFVPGPSLEESSIRILDRSHGLSSADLLAVAEDLAGNLWLGTFDAGAMRIGRGGFVTYGPDDGLPVPRNRQILDSPDGEILVIGGARYAVYRFDGQRFEQTLPALPSSIDDMGWGRRQISLHDSRGEWWFGTFGGLVRFPAVRAIEELASIPPKEHYTTRDDLISDGIFRVFEDRHGDLWISGMHYTIQWRNGLQRWERATGTFHTYREDDGVPQDAPTAFREDDAGNLWVGYYARGIGRFRGGDYRHFTNEDGAPTGHVTTLLLDRRGRMWIGVDGGVFRVDEPGSEQPRFRWYGATEGLAGTVVFSIAEDDWGRIYLGTEAGIDRLEPETGHVRRYSRADGLPSNKVILAHRNADGSLWFGTTLGVSRLEPREDPPNEAPPVRIVGLRIAGKPVAISPFGETDLDGVRLAPSERQLEIEYSGLSFVTGEALRFQYMLEGSSEDWSEPTADRRLQFAGLAPGRYRFAVRAVDSEELVSPHPAVVSFRVLAPVWQRWWFVSLMVALVMAVAFAFHRVRVRRLVELERVRTRIATDLHDDIGSSLSQVSILSEVVRQQVQGERPSDAAPLLEQIAGTSRELVDSMSDIVWAVNPRRDRAADLVQRMRRFASDTFSGKGIAFSFEAPEAGQDRRLDVETRRQVYLIFKEAVNNAAKHSGCEAASVEFEVDGRELRLTVADEGRGFDVSDPREGHGLESMRDRAEAIGGTLDLESKAGAGTTVRLRVPL